MFGSLNGIQLQISNKIVAEKIPKYSGKQAIHFSATWTKEETLREILKTEQDVRENTSQIIELAKIVLRGKFITLNAYIRKEVLKLTT